MSYLEGLPPGWMDKSNVDAIQRISFGMKRTDYCVLEIGSFLGRSTLQWFTPYQMALNNKEQGIIPPSVMCIDMFDYKFIPTVGRKRLEDVGYKIDWKGNMLRDFDNNVKEYAKYITRIQSSFPSGYRIDPDERFDIIFLDTTRTFKNMIDTLETVKFYAIPYRTLICGPHYSSEYAPDVVNAVNQFCNKIGGRFESYAPSNLWGIRVQAG